MSDAAPEYGVPAKYDPILLFGIGLLCVYPIVMLVLNLFFPVGCVPLVPLGSGTLGCGWIYALIVIIFPGMILIAIFLAGSFLIFRRRQRK